MTFGAVSLQLKTLAAAGTCWPTGPRSAPTARSAGRGTNVFVLDADGRIEEVTGFWSA